MRKLIVGLLRFYQKYLSPRGFLFRFLFLTEAACRFRPSCSQYTLEAVSKYGSLKGFWRGLNRVLKCHPWSRGGADSL